MKHRTHHITNLGQAVTTKSPDSHEIDVLDFIATAKMLAQVDEGPGRHLLHDEIIDLLHEIVCRLF